MPDEKKSLTTFAAIIFAAVLILGGVAFFLLKGCPPPPKETTLQTESTEEPPPPIGEKAIKIRFPEGRMIKTISSYTVTGRGFYKDWGMSGESGFVLNGIFQTEMNIEESNKDRFSGTIKVTESVIEELALEDPTVQIDMGDRFHTAAAVGVFAVNVTGGMTIPPGSSKIIEGGTNMLLKTGFVKDLLKDKLTDLAKAQIDVGSLQGVEIHFTYTDGTGITEYTIVNENQFPDLIEEIRQDLEILKPETQRMIGLFDRIFPEEKTRKKGDQWTFDLIDLPIRWPEGMMAGSRGTLTFQRKEDPAKNKAQASIMESSGVTCVFQPKKKKIDVELKNVRGGIIVDTEDEFVELLTLFGDGSIDIRSTDHWLFETRHSVNPNISLKTTVKVRDN